MENINFGVEINIPKYVKFGCLYLNYYKLYYDSILSVVNSNYKFYNNFNSVKISDIFTDILIDMITHKNDEAFKSVKLLNEDEQILYNRLLFKAGLNKMFYIDSKESIKKLTNNLLFYQNEFKNCSDIDEKTSIYKKLKIILFTLYDFKKLKLSELQSEIKKIKTNL